MIMFGRGASGVGNPEMTDAERRASDMIKFGTVKEVDYERARVRVVIGDEEDDEGHLLTGWLPMAGGRAGGDSDWHPLEVGERVMVLSESGEVQNGMVMPAGLYNEDNPAPGDKAGLWRKKFQDGGSVEYDRDSGTFLVDAKSTATMKVGDASVTITAGQVALSVGGVSLVLSGGGIAITGGTVTHDGKEIGKDSRHTGVVPGAGVSGSVA